MESLKPWHVVLMVIALVVFSLSARSFLSKGSIPKTSGYMTVDIMSGQLYDIRKGKAKGVPLPAKHPDTGVRTLYPVNQIDDLIWEIPDGYDTFLTKSVRKGSILENGEFKVEVLPGSPIRFKLK